MNTLKFWVFFPIGSCLEEGKGTSVLLDLVKGLSLPSLEECFINKV